MHRLLERAHLRFYAAVVEGVDLHKAWQQYLPLEDDYNAAKAGALIDWIRESVAAEALAAGQPALIGLLRRDPRKLGDAGTPSLDEFAASLDQAEDFSEAELLALWQERHGQGSHNERMDARRARLIKRLRDALDQLALAPRQQPQAQDNPGLWLAPGLAARLLAAGMPSLQAVADALAQRQGPRWPAVPGVGAVWADRLAQWLLSLGIAAARPAAVAPTASPVRPLVATAGTASAMISSGRPGGLVGEPARSLTPTTTPEADAEAEADLQAVTFWLANRASNPNTARAYGRSAERLLAWCRLERGHGLRQLTPQALADYQRWLQQLGRLDDAAWAAAGWQRPVSDWLGRTAGTRRSDSRWRPFDQPLSAAGVAREWAVVRGLLRCLRDAGHLDRSPWVDGPAPADPQRAAQAGATRPAGTPVLTAAAPGNAVSPADHRAMAGATGAAADGAVPVEPGRWPAGVRAQLLPTGALGTGDRPARLRALLWLVLGCGLRPAEVVDLSLASLRPGDSGWQLHVGSPPQRGARILVLPGDAATALLDYLATVGVDRDALWREAQPDAGRRLAAQPLLRAQRGRRSVGQAALGQASLHSTARLVAGVRTGVAEPVSGLPPSTDQAIHVPQRVHRRRQAPAGRSVPTRRASA
ncbi:MAG: hypothetical protein CFE45_04060 [Burkholderiales bacterium PBB5]|nr:MAG: hypothetical protein CFE45_04060 [Burkholderiales bacterium PBB5]